MKNLERLQQDFKTWVIDQQGDFISDIVKTSTLGRQTRLDIYANAYRARLHEALEADFPVLNAMLGDQVFHSIALEYIQQHPSDNPSLRWFGRHMPGFLAMHDVYSQHSYLSEMAGFEWALRTAFDARNSSRATIEDAAVIPAEAWAVMRPVPCHSARLLEISWNTPSVWNSVIDEAEDPTQPIRLPETVPCLIWRSELMTRFRVLEHEDEHAVIQLLLKGYDFPAMCEQLGDFHHPQDTSVRAATLLKTWLQEGLLASLEYSGP